MAIKMRVLYGSGKKKIKNKKIGRVYRIPKKNVIEYIIEIT